MLARIIDGKHIVIYNGGDLPEGEWFDVSCQDGKIVLTPAESTPAEALAWAEAEDAGAQAAQPRPYERLTVDELREVEGLTDEEWFAELRARGVISGGGKGPPYHFTPVSPPVPPGGLERFLKERG